MDVIKRGYVHIKRPQNNSYIMSYFDKISAWKRRYIILEDAAPDSDQTSRIKILESEAPQNTKHFSMDLDSIKKVSDYTFSTKYVYSIVLLPRDEFVEPIIIGLKTREDCMAWKTAIVQILQKTTQRRNRMRSAELSRASSDKSSCSGGALSAASHDSPHDSPHDSHHDSSHDSSQSGGGDSCAAVVELDTLQCGGAVYEEIYSSGDGDAHDSQRSSGESRRESLRSGAAGYESSRSISDTGRDSSQDTSVPQVNGYLVLESIGVESCGGASPEEEVQSAEVKEDDVTLLTNESRSQSISRPEFTGEDHSYPVQALPSQLQPGHKLSGLYSLNIDRKMALFVVRCADSGSVKCIVGNVGSVNHTHVPDTKLTKLEIFSIRDQDVVVYEFVTSSANQIVKDWNLVEKERNNAKLEMSMEKQTQFISKSVQNLRIPTTPVVQRSSSARNSMSIDEAIP